MDNVNHPSHYNQCDVETIDIIKELLTPEQFEGFLIGNIIKYLDRHKFKNGQEDLEKAQWYAKKEIEENGWWGLYRFVDDLACSDSELAIDSFNRWREDTETLVKAKRCK